MPSAIEVSDSNGTIHTNDDLNRYIHDYAENTINFGKYLHTALPEKTGNAVSEEQKTQLAKGVGNYPAEKPYQSVLSGAPVTVERQLYYPKEGDRLLDPGTARANLAVSLEAPEGTTQDDWAKKHAHETVRATLPCLINRKGSKVHITDTPRRSSNNTSHTGTRTPTE